MSFIRGSWRKLRHFTRTSEFFDDLEEILNNGQQFANAADEWAQDILDYQEDDDKRDDDEF